jgi:hypothetical protein
MELTMKGKRLDLLNLSAGKEPLLLLLFANLISLEKETSRHYSLVSTDARLF